MFFLALHMWLWMLLAAVSGGLIGWALRSQRCIRETSSLINQRDTAVAEAKTLRAGGALTLADSGKVAELEKRLASEQDEIAGLKAKLAATTTLESSASAAVPSIDQEDPSQNQDDTSAIQWRNRYLESRVRFLEGKIAELEKNRNGAGNGDVAISVATSGEDDLDVARLKWRNRYLEGRVRYLEEDASIIESNQRKTAAVVGAAISSSTSAIETDTASEASTKPKTSKKKTKSSKKSTKKSAPKKDTKAVSAAGLVGTAFLSEMQKADGFIVGDEEGKPPTLTAPISGKADDLRKITGVGPKLEKLLHELGVYHFAQIAEWSEKEVDWVDEQLTFKGRIRRDNWIEQCKLLAEEKK